MIIMKIGRSNRTRFTAGNQGLSRRVDNMVDAVVDAHVAKYKTALAVDGALAFIYNKHDGIIPCTCRGFRNLNGIASHEVGLSGNESSKNETSYHEASDQRHATVFSEKKNSIKQVGGLVASDLDALFKDTNVSIVDKIKGRVPLEDEEFVEDSAIDVVDALFDTSDQPVFSGSGDPMEKILAATAIANSADFAFTPNFVACPICLGSGFVDSWRLYNGERIVLDASEAHDIDTFGVVDVDGDEQPPIYTIHERGSVQWQRVKIPTSWRHLIRLAVFDKGKILPTNSYTLYFIHPNQPATKNPFTYDTLNSLNNSLLLQQSNNLTIVIESNLGRDYQLKFTHIEMLFSMGTPIKIQVPDMEVPNEDEYVDWNLTVNMELPPDIEMKENSYIVDGKYRRVWKVSSINRKVTARGKAYGYTVSARALHSFERQFALLNVFKKPRNPYANKELRTMNDEGY